MKSIRKYAWIREAISEAPFNLKARAMKHFLIGGSEYIPKNKTIADIKDIIKCALCPNMCKFDCPVLNSSKNETLSPSGKARISHFIETGILEGDNSAMVTYACTGCSACKIWCPFNFSVGDMMRDVRADNVAKKVIPQKVLHIKEQLASKHTLGERNIVPEGESNTDILYFRGCTIINNNPEIAQAIHKIFEYSGISYGTLKNEWCCGAPLFNLGFLDEFDSFAKKITKQIRESKSSTLVCSCPTCVSMFKNIYPQRGHKITLEVLHISEYIKNLLEDKNLSFHPVEGTYVYHDPCTLARNLSITEPPRAVLEKIPGLIVKENFFNRELTQCCGRGGQFGHLFPEYSDSITADRLSELKKDASQILTACPTCKLSFKKMGAEVLDITEIVAQAIGNDNE